VAIFHMSAKVVQRSAGRSSVAAAAYRAGEKMVDERTGLTHDYTRRAGVEASEIVMPEGCTWEPSREELWSAVEMKNSRANSVTAREFELALPAELSAEQRHALTHDFAKHLADNYHVAVDVSLHTPKGDERNYHAHLLMTTNRIEDDGRLGNKVRDLDPIAHQRAADRDKPNEVKKLREVWADMQNQALERAGRPERVDHRSLVDQGITDRLPGQKLGPAAAAMERRGDASDRGDSSRKIQAEYKVVVVDLDKYRAEKQRLQEQQREQRDTTRREEGWSDRARTATAKLEEQLHRPATVKDLDQMLTTLDRRLQEMPTETLNMVADYLTYDYKCNLHDHAENLAKKDLRLDDLNHDVRNQSNKEEYLQKQVNTGREAQGQLDHYSGIKGWFQRRHDFPRDMGGYKQEWSTFKSQAEHQVREGQKTEKQLPEAYQLLGEKSAIRNQAEEQLPAKTAILEKGMSEAIGRANAIQGLDEARLHKQLQGQDRQPQGRDRQPQSQGKQSQSRGAVSIVDVLTKALDGAVRAAEQARQKQYYDPEPDRKRTKDQGWER